MRWKLGGWGLALLAALALGVGGAGGRTLDTGTLVVQVLGDGNVTASGGQISCGQGGTRCYFSSTTSADITLTASATGFVSWDGCDTTAGQVCTLTLEPGDATEVTATFSPTATTTLTVNVTGDENGDGGNVSTGDNGEIDCNPGDTDCTWDVSTGSTVTLVEQPDTGFDFTGWGGACSGTDVSCTVQMTSAQTVNATFAKSASTHTLTVSVAGNGTITGGGISCTAAGGSGCTAGEDAGSSVTLMATAGSGAGFTGWGGACAGSTTTCTVTMSSDRSVSATFSGAGSGGGGGAATVPLSVSVDGAGTVAGGGIKCGGGSETCSANEPTGSSVTLTATPLDDGDFTGWGGACSGTDRTCQLTMSSARSVTATFSGGSSSEVTLSVSVAGPGTVRGGGITCGRGATTCSAKQAQGSTVGLTAVPAPGASFAGWGGACSGVATACTVELSESKSVSARFRAAAGSAAGAASLTSLGRPIVVRRRSGFAVTLRFRAARPGTVHVRALRAGRLEAALAFTAPPGRATVGPFSLTKPGFYVFDLTEVGHSLRWGACLGRCGEAAARAAGPFALGRRPPAVVDAGALWSVTLRFRSTQPAGVVLRVSRGGRLARLVRTIASPGAETVGPLLLSPGTYALRLTATDAYGRVRTLTWVAILP